ncbi:Hint domain-containing protein [Ruegeria arenilitoris]|uniref:Hint domain-containing protein n=1 Tax=Ruegeria arenilitoris TaxID=1173585 RepID=UPI003463BB22
MLEVVSVSGFSENNIQTVPGDAVSVRRGGLLHGTKVATTSGWKLAEALVAGDLVRTMDNGFQEVKRVSHDRIAVPAGEVRPDFLPVRVPSRAAYNGRAVWLMPEQGMAVALSSDFNIDAGLAIIPARLLSGHFSFSSRTPAEEFQVTSLFFEQDEVVFIEGGFQAFCSSCRIRSLSGPSRRSYAVLEESEARSLVTSIAEAGELSALANPLGALPAPIPQEPIFPIRPPSGVRRPGRPGRPNVPALFLRPEWQT